MLKVVVQVREEFVIETMLQRIGFNTNSQYSRQVNLAAPKLFLTDHIVDYLFVRICCLQRYHLQWLVGSS